MNGVLTKQNGEYIIANNGEDINLSNELKHFYYKDVPVHIQISDGKRSLVNERFGELYLDKNDNGKYVYHTNGINIEEIISNRICKLIDITITEEKKEADYEQKIYNS